MWLIKVMGDRMPTNAGSDHEVAHKDGGEGHRALGEGSSLGQTVCVLVPGVATMSINVAEGHTFFENRVFILKYISKVPIKELIPWVEDF